MTQTDTETEKILRERAAALADRRNFDQCNEKSKIAFLIFHVDGTQYGIQLADLTESSQITEITPLPGADQHLLGLTACRGELKAIFDLAGWLGSEATENALQQGFFLFLNQQNDTGFLIDELNEICHFTRDQIEAGTIEEASGDLCYAKVDGINLIETSRLLGRLTDIHSSWEQHL